MTPAWVIVTGGVARHAGQDRANYELARYLAERGGTEVHIVAHLIDAELERHPAVTFHKVRKPLGSFILGSPLLDFEGRRIAAQVKARLPGTRVVVNGSSCACHDVNWVHTVLTAWPDMHAGAPWTWQWKERFHLWHGRRSERQILQSTRLAIANSKLTRAEVVNLLSVEPAKVHVVYYGGEREVFGPPTSEERSAARAQFGLQETDDPTVVFVGALGYSTRKGFDTLLNAWDELCGDPAWKGNLLAAGGGRLDYWGEQIRQRSLTGRVKLLGHTPHVAQLLAAADILVSPARHEAFGLNVYEALCRGLPAMVTARTGVAEVYPASLSRFLLEDPNDAAALAERLRWWHRERNQLAPAFAELGQQLGERTWRQMAVEMVELIEKTN